MKPWYRIADPAGYYLVAICLRVTSCCWFSLWLQTSWLFIFLSSQFLHQIHLDISYRKCMIIQKWKIAWASLLFLRENFSRTLKKIEYPWIYWLDLWYVEEKSQNEVLFIQPSTMWILEIYIYIHICNRILVSWINIWKALQRNPGIWRVQCDKLNENIS